MLILTGARRQEIFGLSWQEVDSSVAAIRLPAKRSKVKEGRLIPMSQLALELLERLPTVNHGTFVFSFTGEKRFDNVGRAKPKVDRMIAQKTGAPTDAWRRHDSRRTVATGMQRLGVRLEVMGAVLGHVAGSRAGIVGTYSTAPLRRRGENRSGSLGLRYFGVDHGRRARKRPAFRREGLREGSRRHV